MASPPRSRESFLAEENKGILETTEDTLNRHSEIIDGWGDQHWSRLGLQMHVPYPKLHVDDRAQLDKGSLLNSGGFGTVSAVRYRHVRLARKTIALAGTDSEQRKWVLEEGEIARKLGNHRHIVRFVGTYTKKHNDKDALPNEFNILTFPVATCDLARFLDDVEEVLVPRRTSPADIPETVRRLDLFVSLGFHVSRTSADLGSELKGRLQEMMGCIAEAVVWMHANDIEHRDIKPANILLHAGHALLTDFGIARDRLSSPQTLTERHLGHCLGYAAPEILAGEAYNPRLTDVYSLGCASLHILSVIYGPNVQLNVPPHLQHFRHPNRHYTRERFFKAFLQDSLEDTKLKAPHQFLPDDLVTWLLAPMLRDEATRRPIVNTVSHVLTLIGSSALVFHGKCCHAKFSSGTSIYNSSTSDQLAASSVSVVTLRSRAA